MQCPGQDTRYWKPDDVFEIPCQACGHAVEFFKTDASRRCARCGERLQNPRVSMGCAQWCAYAKECLGFDPKEVQLVEAPEGSLVDRIVAAMRPALGADQDHLTRALQVLEQAQDILQEEEADPQVVLAAALLHDLGAPPASEAPANASGDPVEEGLSLARQVLSELNLKDDAIERVCGVIHTYHRDGGGTTPEARVVWDAAHLVAAPEGIPSQSEERLEAIVQQAFHTPTGRKLAIGLVRQQQAAADGGGVPVSADAGSAQV